MTLHLKTLASALVLCGGALTLSLPAQADSPLPLSMSGTWKFDAQDGEAIYRSSCQGCHMSDGMGAKAGAGFYPALGGNNKLSNAAFPVSVILKGQNGMPSLRAYMSDAQIAAVVNYVRSHFGNAYTDTITAADIPK